MKRILAGALLALLTLSAYATTFVPPALINPAGSTAGQALLSTGPTGAVGFGTVTPAAIGGLTAANNLSDVASATAARTNLGLGTSATVNTGTSGATVPLLNGANTWSGAQTFTALITPTSTVGIKATATNDSVQAGSVGEPATSTGSTSLTNNTVATVTSINLAAGDWQISGSVAISGSGGAVITNAQGGISTTAATLGAFGSYSQLATTLAANAVVIQATPTVHLKFASTTTVYCVADSTFSAGTVASSCVINAIRPR